MRSLHLTHTDISSDSRILKEMRALAEGGYDLTGIGVTIDEEEHKTELKFNADIHSVRLGSRKFTFLPRTLRHIFSLLELVLKMLPLAIRSKPDVVHCHDTLVLPIGVIVKLFTRAKLVYDAHELESDRNGLSGIQSFLTLWVEKLLWRSVDALIVVSPSIEQWYQRTVGPKPSSIILNSPSFSNDIELDTNYLREKFNIPMDCKIFIYVGILGHGRGIDLLTGAFSREEVSSHIVFLGYGELEDGLREMAAEYPNIHVHDAVPHSEVVPIVRSADFGTCLVQNVSLSDYYCLPNKLFEYCFAGVPVLASNFPDISDVVQKYNMGVCVDLSEDSVKKGILDFQDSELSYLTDKEKLNELSWASQEEKLLKLYSRLI